MYSNSESARCRYELKYWYNNELKQLLVPRMEANVSSAYISLSSLIETTLCPWVIRWLVWG